MKPLTIGFLLLFLFASSCTPPSSFNSDPWVGKWVEMWNTYNLDEVDHLFVHSDDLSYFSSEKEGIIMGLEAVKEHHAAFGFVAGGKEPTSQLWLENIQVSGSDRNPIVTAIWYFHKANGELQHGPVTIIYTQSGEEYLIQHMNFGNYDFPEWTELPDGIQGYSLTGKPLVSTPPGKRVLSELEAAQKVFMQDPDVVENWIWLGRWTAYSGNYRKAIQIYSEGLKAFPGEPRLFRHRGHRYISIREFDRAIYDFEMAAKLIQGTENIMEPDGMPNAQNIPVSSLHGNIWYHLGLAYYLKGAYQQSLDAFTLGLNSTNNDDNVVSVTHWIYMNNRLLGEEQAALEALEGIKADMNIIENMSYHQLCLFYKGEISEEELLGDELTSSAGDAVLYGLANWHYYNNDPNRAKEIYEQILKGSGWASFGYIAAENDYLRRFN